MLIDSHAHIFNTLSGFGADGELKPLQDGKAIWSNGNVVQLIPSSYKDTVFPPERLLAVMEEAKIDKAVLLQGGFLGFDNYGVSEAVKKYPEKFRGAATVDPYCRNKDTIINHLLTLGLDAFKFEVSTGCGLMGSHFTFDINSEMMHEIYRKLAPVFKTIAFDMGSPEDESHQMEALRKIADTYPETNIVVCHLGSPRRDQDENIKRELELLRRDNIFFDTAALFWKVRPEAYPYPSARRYLEYARDIVGAEHLMWGTDVPSTITKVSIEDQLHYSDGIFNVKELEWYLHGTAEKVYFS